MGTIQPVASGILPVNGTELYYERYGSGEPLVLIEGLGYFTWQWFKQVPELSRHFGLVLFDNRGVGRSAKPPGPYTAPLLAADTAGLLEALGIERAHVLGTSMGGFIGLQLALDHPDRVRSLILACTSMGGPNSLPMTQETFQAMTRPPEGLDARGQLRHALSFAFKPGYMEAHPEEIEQILTWRLANPQPREAQAAQFGVGLSFNVEERLGEVQARTLVAAGTADRVLPPENSELLAAQIPGARLELFPGAGHLFFIEEAARFNRLVVDFLRG